MGIINTAHLTTQNHNKMSVLICSGTTYQESWLDVDFDETKFSIYSGISFCGAEI